MNGRAHKVIGAGAGTAVGLAKVIRDREQYDKLEGTGIVAVAAAGGMIGGMLPDILEPATSPNHRGVAHSFLALLCLILLGVFLWNRKDKITLVQAFGEGLVAGCVSHLAADSLTPKGLPAIG